MRDVDAVLAARGWTGHWWWAGPTERSSRRTGPAAIRTVPWARPGRRRVPDDWLENHGAADPEAVSAVGLVHAAAAPDGLTPRMKPNRWRTQHRARRDRPRARAGPRAGQHHLRAVCGCSGARRRTDTYQPRWGDRSQPEHQDQREGRRQTRCDLRKDSAPSPRPCARSPPSTAGGADNMPSRLTTTRRPGPWMQKS